MSPSPQSIVLEKHYPKPRRRHSEQSKQADVNPPSPEPIVPEISPVQNLNSAVLPQVFANTQPSEQFLPELIEICCPICGCSNLSQDETRQISCEECDYVEAGEFDY
jgi:hypothetical protein